MIRDTQVTLTGEGQLPPQSRAPASLKLQTQPTEVGTWRADVSRGCYSPRHRRSGQQFRRKSGDEDWKGDTSQHLGKQRTFLHKQIFKEI